MGVVPMGVSVGVGVDLTPKHQINTPIIEETDSVLEAEILRSRQSRRDK